MAVLCECRANFHRLVRIEHLHRTHGSYFSDCYTYCHWRVALDDQYILANGSKNQTDPQCSGGVRRCCLAAQCAGADGFDPRYPGRPLKPRPQVLPQVLGNLQSLNEADLGSALEIIKNCPVILGCDKAAALPLGRKAWLLEIQSV
jgi:hypothetical protein